MTLNIQAVDMSLVQLGDVVEFLDYLRKPVVEEERILGPYPYYGANGQQGWIDRYLFDESLVLLAEDGGHFENPERGIAYLISGKTWVNNHAHVLRPKEGVDLTYLYRVLENADVRKYVTGTTRAKLTKAGASRISIPLPSLENQRRIADILDQADALRTKRRAALAHLDVLTQSIFVDMFSNPAVNPKRWPVVTLGDVVTAVSDGPHVSPEYVDSGVPFLSARHVRAGEIIWSDLKYLRQEDAEIQWKKCKPQRDDILYTKGGTTGLAAAVRTDEPFAVWVHVALVRPDRTKVEPMWLESMLNSAFCYAQSQRYTHGIANRDLGLTRMVKIKMILPPLDDQRAFLRRRDVIDRIREVQSTQLAHLDALFISLQHRAFRGEL